MNQPHIDWKLQKTWPHTVQNILSRLHCLAQVMRLAEPMLNRGSAQNRQKLQAGLDYSGKKKWDVRGIFGIGMEESGFYNQNILLMLLEIICLESCIFKTEDYMVSN